MPIFFPNVSMDIYTYDDNNTDYDYYGKKNKYIFNQTVKVDMQPYSPSSSIKEFGKILQDTYIIIFDENIEIHETDQIIINNQKYEIIGSIENWNHGLIPHKEMLIQKLRKGESNNNGS